MSNSYFTLKVVAITRETSDAVTLHFEHPDKQPIRYKPGQFLTLIIPFEGKKVRRSYSLSSTPHELPRLSITVKRVAGGLVSNYLVDTVQIGQEIEVMEPIGNFCLTCDSNQTRHIILLGAGSGITPLMSILKSVLHEEPHSKVTLLYGNRDEDAVIFKKELEKLGEAYPDRLVIEHIYSRPKLAGVPPRKSFSAKLLGAIGLSKDAGNGQAGKSNRMNQKSIADTLVRLGIANQENAVYFLCGPEGMMDEAQKALTRLNVPDNRVFKERFVHKTTSKPVTSDNTSTEGINAVAHTVTILHNDVEYKVKVQPDKSILEAALDENIDLPYSCQAGLCTACMGKCLSGKVKMDDQDGLSDAELKEGYVLNCVGHPLTDDVVIKI